MKKTNWVSSCLHVFMVVFVTAQIGAQEQVALTPGMVIDRSITVKPGTYRLPSASFDAPAIVVRGSNITVDLAGVTNEGADSLADRYQVKDNDSAMILFGDGQLVQVPMRFSLGLLTSADAADIRSRVEYVISAIK
jgi:hypothetical protein